MNVALDKTVQEFKMWGSMARKPGQPAAYLEQLYKEALEEKRLAPSGTEKYPEVVAERVWETIIKKLLKKEYSFDTGFYGSLNEFSRKVAYFFHASLQGTGCFPGAIRALQQVAASGLNQGLVADGQCFTTVQLQRGLAQQGRVVLDDLVPVELRVLSHEVRARKPSEQLFRQALEVLEKRGVAPEQVLHVGSRLPLDIAPARRLGLKTALFAGDRASLQATPEQLKDPARRPDVLLTELSQIADVLPG
jgi:FMN phosphatase YigB (HAD superfamily)